VYTVSRDGTLKRWRVQGGGPAPFQLAVELQVDLGDACWCMVHASEWVFCGLSNGQIRAFHKQGRDLTLAGHDQGVSAMLVHQEAPSRSYRVLRVQRLRMPRSARHARARSPRTPRLAMAVAVRRLIVNVQHSRQRSVVLDGFLGHGLFAFSPAFHEVLLSGSAEGSVRCWRMQEDARASVSRPRASKDVGEMHGSHRER